MGNRRTRTTTYIVVWSERLLWDASMKTKSRTGCTQRPGAWGSTRLASFTSTLYS